MAKILFQVLLNIIEVFFKHASTHIASLFECFRLFNWNLCILQALTEYRAELRDDPIINTHLAKLYDNLLEQNLIRVIEPFSRVQVRTR